MMSRRFMPPDRGSTAGRAAVVEAGEVQQLSGPLPDLRHGQAEVAAVDDEVVPDGQLGVEVVLLGDDTEPGPDRRAVRHGVHAQDAELAVGDGRDAGDHAHGRGLAGAVGPEESEDLAAVAP